MKKIGIICFAVIILLSIAGCNCRRKNDIKDDITVVIEEDDSLIVNFDSQGGSVIESKKVDKDDTLYTLPTPLRNGYTFNGWYDGDKRCYYVPWDESKQITLYAHWYPIRYKITYDLNGGTNDANNPTTYTIDDEITLNDPKKAGYTFKGWSEGGKILKGSTGNKIFIAVFEATQYNIMLDVAGGDSLNDDIIKVNYNDNFSLPIPSKYGYVFDGWYYSNYKIDDGMYSYTSDITLVAKWISIFKYTTLDEGIEIIGLNDRNISDLVVFEYIDGQKVVSIGKTAFNGCNILKKVEIPNSVTSIESGAFSGCSSLELITLPFVGDMRYTSSDRCRYPFGYIFGENIYTGGVETTQYYYGSSNSSTTSTTYYIPSSLKEVIITDCEYIQYGAFYNCSLLTSIEIPNSVTSIESWAFNGCSSLTSIEIPNSVTSIGDFVFRNCSSLTSIEIPNSVTSMGSYAFYDSSIKNAICPAIACNFTRHKYLKTVVITSGTSIESSAFESCDKLISVTIADTVTSIGNGAFSRCSSLTSIEIPNSVTSIGNYTFSGCSSLTSIEIPNSVTSIGSSAFNGCSSLTSIQIPNSVISIGSSIFLGCSSLESITLPFVGDKRYTSSDTYQYPFGYIFGANSYTGAAATTQYYYVFSTSSAISTKYYIPSSLKEVIITDCEYIQYGAFYNCSLLTSIEISNGVTSIGYAAFNGCRSLTSITIGNGVTNIGDDAFYNSPIENASVPAIACNFIRNKYLKTVVITSGTSIVPSAFESCDQLISVTIADTVTSIGSSAFSGCSSLTSIEIPNSVTTIGEKSFYECASLESIIVDENNPIYDSRDNCNAIILTEKNKLLFGCQNTIIPDDVTSIGEYAFYHCIGLESIIIPNSVVNIADCVFYNCNKLENLTIGSGLTTLGSNVFYDCTSLMSIIVNENNMFYDSRENCNALILTGTNRLLLGCPNSIIPNSVTSIGDYAFRNYSSLTSIEIPNSVTSIGERVFSGCSSLESITLPFVGDKRHTSSDTYQYPFGYIFGGDSYTGGTSIIQYYYGKSISYTTLSVYSIPSSLREVIITDCDYIQYGAFYNCSSLTSITIPNSVTSIGDSAFYNCSSLTNIEIPNSVTSIGSSIFLGCSSLESITLPFVGDKRYTSSDRYQYPFGYIFGENSYTGAAATTQYYYGSSTSSATSTKYYIPSSLKEVIITDCEYIQYGAFYNCNNIEKITVLCDVTSIGECVFYYCNSLISCSLPDSVTIIGSRAFSYCSSLVSITVPNSVTVIGDDAFYKCISLESIIVDEKNPIYDSRENCNAIILTEKNKLLFGCQNTIIPDDITIIGKNAFYECIGLTYITIPERVTIMEECAFGNCNRIETVNIYSVESWCNIQFSSSESNPLSYAHDLYLNNELITDLVISNSVTSIGNYAFYNCSLLTSIEIPNSVTSIGEYAFFLCSSLTSIEIPDSVTSIGYAAFNGCRSLTSITIGNSVTSIGDYAFAGCLIEEATIPAIACKYIVNYQLKTVVITSGTSIVSSAFENCRGLISVTIADTVTSIGERAFYGCSSLTNIEIPNSVTSIGKYTFYKCISLTSIEIPNSVTNIGTDAFYNSPIENASVPAIACNFIRNKYLKTVVITSGTSIVPSAFESCDQLISVTIADTVTSIGSSAFSGCSSLTSIEIPNSVTSIGYSAFNGCSSLTSIEIPTSVTNIGESTFYNCSSLVDVTFGDNVTSIGNSAFNGCSSLTSIEIPNSVTSIGNYAFYKCIELLTIILYESVISVGDYAFSECSKLSKIVLYNSSMDIGNNVFYRSNSLVIYCKFKSQPAQWPANWNCDKPVVWGYNG